MRRIVSASFVCMSRLCLLGAVMLLLVQGAAAQGTISGKVLSPEGNPLVGATVKAGNESTMTNTSGAFTVKANAGTQLSISYVGYETQRVAASPGVVVTLQPSANTVEEVIVTGVATGQSRKKTPFAVTKVNSESINIVPATDASQSLRGRVAGIQISQTQGDQGAAVFLRGAKSVFGNIAPLVVVDGFQTTLSLSDLNPEDIESIEVVKGAAAASLYGARAEGGVIQVISKKGKGMRNQVNIVVDNEVGMSDIQRTPELTRLHPYKVDASGNFVLNGFQRTIDYKQNGYSVNLNPYPVYYDNTRALLDNQPYYSNFISASTNAEMFNLYASFQNQFKGGIVEPMGADKRRTAKFNFGFRPTSKIETGITVQYYNEIRPSAALSRDNQGTVFASTLQFEPFINLRERDASGDYAVSPKGFEIQNANLQNPLYEWSARDYQNNSDNILVGGNFKYRFNSHLNAEVSGSYNTDNFHAENYYPVGYKTRLPNTTLNNGFFGISNNRDMFKNGNAQINYHNVFGNTEFSASAKYIYEENKYTAESGQGSRLSAPVRDLGATDPTTRSLSSDWSQTVRHNYFLTSRLGWSDKIFVDGLVRLDNSSRYGPEAAKALFYRGAVAYRLTQDVDLGPVTEFKLRAAYGTAGSEPPFGARESRVTVTNSGISVQRRENTRLSRSVTSELEVGFDAVMFNRINVQFNYADANSENDFILVPPFAPTSGSAAVYANLGAVKSNSIELELNGDAIRGRKFNWNTAFTFGRVRSQITNLGEVPAFTSNGLFRKDVGLSAYAFWGQKVLRSLSDLQVDKNGVVLNAGSGLRPEDFVLNPQGFVVEKSKLGTKDERPVFYKNAETGNNMVLGRGEPDFQIGFGNTFTFGGLSVFAMVDWKKGGLKYNQTTQYLTFDSRTMVWENLTRAGLPQPFIQQVYNGNSLTDYWLEDNSFVAVRELSLSYNLGGSKIGNLGKVLKNTRLAVIGRNLWTFTDYSGSNIEGYYEYYPYPVYRTYSAKLTFNF